MLRERLSEALKQAQKSKDARAVATLRLILAALKDRDIAARAKGNGDGISNDEIQQMLQKMIRQNRESMEMYEKGERPDLVQKEAEEIEIIERFLPKQLDETEIRSAIDEVLSEVGAQSIKDMGSVMSALRARYAGRMDFGRASTLVKERLV